MARANFKYREDGVGRTEYDIFRGAALGDLFEVQSALKESPELLNARHDVSGQTPLSIAAFNGNVSIVSFLVSCKGVDLRSVCNSGISAYRYALLNGHPTVKRILFESSYPDYLPEPPIS